MLSPEYLLRVSEGAEEIAERLHQDIVKRLIQRIVARLERGDDYILTPIDKYQLETLKQAGFLMKDIEKEIAAKTKLQRAEIRAAFEDAGIRSYAYDSRVYEAAGLATKPLTQSPQYIRMMQRAYEATLGEWRNFSRTTAGEAYRRFIVECDRAYYSVQSGAISYTQAFREAINRIADEGVVVAYRDKDGNITRRDTIETATLRNIRTGISQSCAEITNARMEEMDWDILLVSAHLGARYTEKNDYTNHFWWQGKFYSKSGKDERFPPFSVCGQGEVQGINGANCRHSYSPGDGETNPFSDYDSEENKKAYDLSQKQRQLENRIRHTKRQVMAIKEGRDYAEHPDHKAALDEDYKKKAAKLERQNKEYKDFCEQNGLKTRQERLTIAKWDRQQAAEARGAAARYKNSRSTEPREKPDTSTVEVTVGTDIYNVEKPMSEYRDASGRFDIDKANADYEKLLTKVPEEYKMSIETAYKTTEFEENTEISSAFRYDTKRDRVVYNPRYDNFDDYSYPQAVTHELSHRIDALDYHSEKNAKFSKAIDDAYPVAMRNAERLSEYSASKDGDGFVSDIISALSNGEVETMAYHSTKYWSKQGTKEKEIFANLFSMGVFDQKKHIDLINEIFPEVYEAYNEIRKDV